MTQHINQLAEELGIDIIQLSDILRSFNYEIDGLYMNSTVPDYLANFVRAYVQNDNLLIKLIVDKEYRDTKNDYGPLHVVGKIDLDMFDSQSQQIQQNEICQYNKYSSSSLQYEDKKTSFWIEELVLETQTHELQTIKVGYFSCKYKQPFFSVIIGANGVGKSTLLSYIVDFFIECYACRKDKKHISVTYKGKLVAIRYHIDGHNVLLIRTAKSCLSKVDGLPCPLSDLRLPLIVACHMGAFEKFHNQSVNGSVKTKYDVPYYKYVGAHVNGNIISSSGIVFRLLFTLSDHMDDNRRRKICSILDFIQYEHTISIQYSMVMKYKKSKDARDIISQHVDKDFEYAHLTIDEKNEKKKRLFKFYSEKSTDIETKHNFTINFDEDTLYKLTQKSELQSIYKLKQWGLVNTSDILFKKKNQIIHSTDMSSGEFALLSTILSIASTASEPHTLVLLDEPEISQHPNWQMSIIENLDNVLANYVCHLLIATHSHMIVSDLPIDRSCVVQLEKSKEGRISSKILQSSTYGWSAEEVLLEVFNTATDRNRYFGERIADLLEKMGNNSISPENVRNEICELSKISEHLNDKDPMKLVLSTIIEAFKNKRR